VEVYYEKNDDYSESDIDYSPDFNCLCSRYNKSFGKKESRISLGDMARVDSTDLSDMADIQPECPDL
jgi:hypothetical protein